MLFATMTDSGTVEAAELPLPLPWNAAETRLQLGALLVRDGLLSPEQLEEALAEKEASGRRLGEIVLERGWISPSVLARALAEQHDLEYTDLARTEIELSAAGLLPEKFARRYHALPVRFLDEETVLVAVADPTNVVTSDDLRLALGLNVRLTVVSAPDLMGTIGRIYRTPTGFVDAEFIEEEEEPQEDTRVEDIREGVATSAPAIKLVNSLIPRAIDEGASDLHFEPALKGITVRARVDGVMRKIAVVPQSLQPAVTSRLKIMGELDIAE